jgi:hypothetical protein
MVADNETLGVEIVGVFFPPFVLLDGFQTEAIFGVDGENLLNEFLQLWGEGGGDGIIS